MTVLVVEDDPAVLRSHTKLLEQGGFDVLRAVNGMEAFDRLRGSVAIHAILCDVDMPTLNGTGFFEQLEEILPQMASRVVFITGYVDKPEIRKFLEQTGQPFLGKPTNSNQLVNAVRQMVERGGSGGLATMRGTK